MQDFEVIALFRRKYIGFGAFFKQYRQQKCKKPATAHDRLAVLA